MTMASPLYSNLRSYLNNRGLQDQGPAEPAEIMYPEGLTDEDDRKEHKRNELRAKPESLFVDYKIIKYKNRDEQKRAKTNFVFHTDHHNVWYSTVCGVFPHPAEKNIDHGRQVKVSEQPDPKKPELTINVYDNGTVMVQGGERHLDQFQNNFLNLKKVVEQQIPGKRREGGA